MRAERNSALSVIEEDLIEYVNGDVTDVDDDSHEHAAQPVQGERAGIYLAALVALAVPSIIVLAFLMPGRSASTTVDPRIEQAAPVGLDSSEVPERIDTPVDEPALDDAPLDDAPLDDAVAAETTVDEITTDVAGVAVAAPDADEVTTEPVDAVEPIVSDDPPTPTVDLSLITPNSIEVFVYDETPPADGEYSFALRLKSLATPVDIDTSLFSVVVEDANGTPATTSTRFVHDTLPVGSSSLATVRAGDTGAGENVVVIALGDVEIARVPIEFN